MKLVMCSEKDRLKTLLGLQRLVAVNVLLIAACVLLIRRRRGMLEGLVKTRWLFRCHTAGHLLGGMGILCVKGFTSRGDYH